MSNHPPPPHLQPNLHFFCLKFELRKDKHQKNSANDDFFTCLLFMINNKKKLPSDYIPFVASTCLLALQCHCVDGYWFKNGPPFEMGGLEGEGGGDFA